MGGQPFYHLRPNKSIDRNLFVQTLIGLSQIYPISEYRYTGFGSYLFDDFKMLHDTLNISKMVSLESDDNTYKRAIFNLPYGCIDVKKLSSTDYLSDLMLDDMEHNIFWLDFVSPSEMGTQLSDYATLLNILNPNDIVRITLNANPNSLGKFEDHPKEKQKLRLSELKRRVKDEWLPPSLKESAVTINNYPITLLKILKEVTTQALPDFPPYSPKFMMPLFSSVYADGQQMLTFTGIVLDSHDEEKQIKESLKNYPHNTFSWTEPCRIQIPSLTTRELTEINKLLPGSSAQQQLEEKFEFVFEGADGKIDDQALKSYIQYYKYYPNYHQISL